MTDAPMLSAFPVLPPCDMEGASASGYPYPEAGMTLRDYFAASAMQGMLANFEWMKHAATECHVPGEQLVPQMAYELADAMLKERTK